MGSKKEERVFGYYSHIASHIYGLGNAQADVHNGKVLEPNIAKMRKLPMQNIGWYFPMGYIWFGPIYWFLIDSTACKQ
jgi:hypothetical protein